jgi:hypothetical protein
MRYLLIVGILYAAVRGLYQGIIMHKPNPRDHRLFGLYHRIMFLDAAFAAWFGILLDRTIGVVPDLVHYPYLAGIFLIGWQVFECVYNLTRHGMMFPYDENVFGSSKRIAGWKLQVLHAGRVIAGVLLLSISGAI